MWVHHGRAANFHDASFPGAGFFQHKMLLGRCQRASDQEFHGFCGGWSHISSHEMQGKFEALLSMAQEKGHFWCGNLLGVKRVWIVSSNTEPDSECLVEWNRFKTFSGHANRVKNRLFTSFHLVSLLWSTVSLWSTDFEKYHDLDIPDNSKNSIIGRPFDKPCVCFSTRSVSKNTLSAPLGILTSVFCMSNWLTHGPGSLAMRRFTGSPDRC